MTADCCPLLPTLLPLLRSCHPTARRRAGNRGNWFGPAWCRAVYNYPCSFTLCPLLRRRKQSQVSQAQSPTPSDCHMERSEWCQDCTDGPVGPGPGGLQGRVSASVPPASVPWALPGSRKQPLPHLRSPEDLKGKASRRRPILGPRHFPPPVPLRDTDTCPWSPPRRAGPPHCPAGPYVGRNGPQGRAALTASPSLCPLGLATQSPPRYHPGFTEAEAGLRGVEGLAGHCCQEVVGPGNLPCLWLTQGPGRRPSPRLRVFWKTRRWTRSLPALVSPVLLSSPHLTADGSLTAGAVLSSREGRVRTAPAEPWPTRQAEGTAENAKPPLPRSRWPPALPLCRWHPDSPTSPSTSLRALSPRGPPAR